MIARMTILAGAFASLAFSAGAVRAQGYFDFSSIPGVGSNPSVEINLNPAMLGFVQEAVGSSGEPGAADLLAGIEGVRVRVYNEVEDPEAVIDFIDDTSGRLERDGWQRGVYIRDDEDRRVHIYLKFGDDTDVAGMTVMISDGDEAVFINIAGRIKPETLGAVSRAMGIDSGVLGSIGDRALDIGRSAGAEDEDEDE